MPYNRTSAGSSKRNFNNHYDQGTLPVQASNGFRFCENPIIFGQAGVLYKECHAYGNDVVCDKEGGKCVCPTGWNQSGNVLTCDVTPKVESR